MSNEDENENSPPKSRPRRASITELFAGRQSAEFPQQTTNNPKFAGSSLASALAQQAQQQSRSRRLSVTTLGLSASPTSAQQTPPFGSLKREQSINRGHGRKLPTDEYESAVSDDDAVGPLSSGGGANMPNNPLVGRRLSFGARVYSESRSLSGGSASSVGGGSIAGSSGMSSGNIKPSSPPTARSPEGFNWSENLRTRAQRSSISAVPGFTPHSEKNYQSQNVPNIGAVPVQPPLESAQPLPKAIDHFQERILKGDFYMD